MSRLLCFLGRFSVAVLCTLVGAGAGLFLGLWRGLAVMNATPPAPATMGFESAGAASVLVLAFH